MNFDIKDPADWKELGGGEIIELPGTGERNVSLQFNTSGSVSIMVADNSGMEDAVLLAHSSGMFSASFTAKGNSYLSFVSDEATVIFMATRTRSMVAKRPPTEVYTSVEPRTRRNSDLDRMMQLVKVNQAQRDAQVAEELAQVRAERAAIKAEREAERESAEIVDDTPETATVEPGAEE